MLGTIVYFKRMIFIFRMSEKEIMKVTEPKADTDKSAAAEGKESKSDGKEEIGKTCQRISLCS